MAIAVPESRNLPYTLSDGKAIIIEGSVLQEANRFSINLCEGPNCDSRTALHMDVRFDQEAVVRNHKDGDWGDEERHGGFPFDKGQKYKVKVIVRSDAYEIIVNNQRFCEFHHRHPMEMAQFLYIAGDTALDRIHFADGIPPDAENPNVPYTVGIPGGIYPGLAIVVSGVPNEGLDRFSVNLVCGGDFHSDDVALHMDNRFQFGDDHNLVVRTAKVGGDWGDQEQEQDFFPFEQGVDFDIRVIVEESGYKIQVNNQDFARFDHRVQPPAKANHLHVEGNVKLTHVRFQ